MKYRKTQLNNSQYKNNKKKTKRGFVTFHNMTNNLQLEFLNLTFSYTKKYGSLFNNDENNNNNNNNKRMKISHKERISPKQVKLHIDYFLLQLERTKRLLSRIKQ